MGCKGSSEEKGESPEDQLFIAAEAGDLDTVKQLVGPDDAAGTKISMNVRRSSDGRTALMIAAAAGKVNIVDYFLLLLLAGEDVDTALTDTTEDEFTALDLALLKKHKNVVAALVKANCSTKTPKSLLMIASIIDGEDGSILARKALEGEGAVEVNFIDEPSAGGKPYPPGSTLGDTALHMACVSGNVEVATVLLQKGADLSRENDLGKTPVNLAQGNPTAALFDGKISLIFASSYGLVDIVREMLAETSGDGLANKTDENGNTAILLAAHKGYYEIVNLLLSHGADPNLTPEDGNNALHIAVFYRQPETVEALLTHEKMNQEGEGADRKQKMLNAENAKQFSTPCHLAAYKGFLEILKILVKHGADVDAEDGEAQTPLIRAAQLGYTEAKGGKDEGHSDCIDFFLQETNCDINAQDCEGQTALHFAASEGSVRVVQLILDHCKGEKRSLEIDLQNAEGSTALHDAASFGHKDVVELLLSAGADRTLKDLEECTALDRAMEHKFDEIIPVLKE